MELDAEPGAGPGLPPLVVGLVRVAELPVEVLTGAAAGGVAAGDRSPFVVAIQIATMKAMSSSAPMPNRRARVGFSVSAVCPFAQVRLTLPTPR